MTRMKSTVKARVEVRMAKVVSGIEKTMRVVGRTASRTIPMMLAAGYIGLLEGGSVVGLRWRLGLCQAVTG